MAAANFIWNKGRVFKGLETRASVLHSINGTIYNSCICCSPPAAVIPQFLAPAPRHRTSRSHHHIPAIPDLTTGPAQLYHLQRSLAWLYGMVCSVSLLSDDNRRKLRSATHLSHFLLLSRMICILLMLLASPNTETPQLTLITITTAS